MPRLVSATVMLSDTAAAERVSDVFRRHGFDISEVVIAPDAIHLETLPQLLAETGAEQGERVVVASNVVTYLFAWYRVWNHLADAYVLLVDPKSPAFAAAATEPLLNALASFIAIDKDPVQGPLYIDLTLENSVLFSDFFGQTTYLDRIAPLDSFPFESPFHRKTLIPRRYRLGDETVVIEGPGGETDENADPERTVSLDDPETRTSVGWDRIAEQAPATLPFAIAAALVDERRSDDAKIDVLNRALESLVPYPPLHTPTAQVLTPILRLQPIGLRVRAMLAYRLGRETRHPDVLQTFGEVVKRDYLGTPLEFCGFFTFYMLQQWFKIPPYAGLYADQRFVLDRVIATVRQEVLPHIKAPPRRERNRLLIAIGECPDAGRYGPISAGVGKARAFKRVFPEWNVAVAITDRHRMDAEENVLPEDRPISARFENALRDLSGGESIDWILPHPTLPRRERSATLVEAIRGWAPQVVCSFSADRDPVRGLLYPDYPIVERAVGYPVVKADDADVYLSYLDDALLAKEFDEWGVPDDQRSKYTHYRGMFTLPTATRVHSRLEYGLPESGFILAIVGYELRNILRDEILHLLANVMGENEGLHLALVGARDVPQIGAILSPALQNRAHRLGPVEDLAGFYTLCDGVAAPAQPGGGIAHAMAMRTGVPVLIEGGHDGDIVLFTGKENVSENTTAFAYDLRRLVSEPTFATEVARRGTRAIEAELATQEDVLRHFMAQLMLAEERFQARGGVAVA